MALAAAVTKQVEAEKELGRRLDEYVGQWVALRNSEVVANADTLDELLSIIDVDDVEAVMEVQEATGATCFF